MTSHTPAALTAPAGRHTGLLAALARRLADEPALADTLQLLVGPQREEPAAASPAVALAHVVNDRRLAERRAHFLERALTTGQVRELLGGVSRQAVALRVANGGLLSLEVSGRSVFPDWQFSEDGVRPGLRPVLALLRRGGRGALAADALMRTPVDGGRTPADLLAAGETGLLQHYLSLAGGA